MPPTPALQFDYGFKVRPFFPRLVEPVAERKVWLDQQGIDLQIVGTWPDIFGYGLPPEACVAWHRMLNDTLAEWCADNTDRFAWIASVPLTNAQAAAEELERAAAIGACGVIISSNIENVNIGELPLDPFWAQGRSARPAGADPSGAGRRGAARREVRRSRRSRNTPSTPRSASARC